jgi:hypothetical protein
MNTAIITCPNCGTDIALSQALQEQFRHENEARLAALAGQAEEKARAGFALERQLFEGQLAEERRKREVAQRAELELRKERARSKTALVSSTWRWPVGSTARKSAWRMPCAAALPSSRI